MMEIKFIGNNYSELKQMAREWLGVVDAGEAWRKQAPALQGYATQAPVQEQATYPTAYPEAAQTAMPYVPAPVSAPSVPTAMPTAPTLIPTTVPAYTQEDLMVAAARVMSTAGMPAMQQLLGEFGVAAITQLKSEQYGAFAQRLRELGAQI